MFTKLFIDHPKSVNETYSEHFVHAMSFSYRLFVASLACFIHAIVPGICVTSGSRAITELHKKMVRFRVKPKGKSPQGLTDESAIEYMI